MISYATVVKNKSKIYIGRVKTEPIKEDKKLNKMALGIITEISVKRTKNGRKADNVKTIIFMNTYDQ